MKKSILIRVVIGLVIIGVALVYKYYIAEPEVVENINTNINAEENVNAVIEALKIKDLNIESGELITSPVTISGSASGTWFFEGSFLVDLVDENDSVIAQSYVTALGEWMTEEYVSFGGTLEFSNLMAGDVQTGKLIFRKANPSDLNELDESFELPVKFSE